MRALAIIKRETARAFDMSVTEITARNTAWRYSRPRMAAYLISRELTDKSFPQIARCWAKHHSTILTSVKSAKSYCAEHPEYAKKVDRAHRASAKEIGRANA